jgi:hypothetical protein
MTETCDIATEPIGRCQKQFDLLYLERNTSTDTTVFEHSDTQEAYMRLRIVYA